MAISLETQEKVTATPFFAAAFPLSYDPKPGASLSEPHTVTIRFTEPIARSFTSLFWERGTLRGSLDRLHLLSDGQGLQGVLGANRPLSPGLYWVRWQALSLRDGTFSQGGFPVYWKAESPYPASRLRPWVEVHRVSFWPTVWVSYAAHLGYAFVLGSALASVLFTRLRTGVPPLGLGWSLLQKWKKKGGVFAWFGFLVALAGAAGEALLPVWDGKEFLGISPGAALRLYLGTSPFWGGTARLFGALVAFPSLWIAYRHFATPRKTFSLELVAVLSLVAAEVVPEGWAYLAPWWEIGRGFLFASTEAWLGLLLVSAWVLAPVIRKAENRSVASWLLGKLGVFLVLLLGGGVAVGTWFWIELFGKTVDLWRSEWGQDLARAVMLFGCLVLVRSYHVFRVEPCLMGEESVFAPIGKRLGRWFRKRQVPRRLLLPIGWLLGSFPLECVLCAVFLFFGARLEVDPAASFVVSSPSKRWSQTATDGKLRLLWEECRADRMDVEFLPDSPGEIELFSVPLLSLSNASNPLAKKTFVGHQDGYRLWSFPVKLLERPGKWTLEIQWIDASQSARQSVVCFSWPPWDSPASGRFEAQDRWGKSLMGLGAVAVAGVLVSQWVILRRIRASVWRELAEGKSPGVDPHFSFPIRSWLWGLGVTAIVLFVASFVVNKRLKTDFQRDCRRQGGLWAFSYPVNEGRALSDKACLGCTLEASLEHFSLFEAYRFFLRPTELDTVFSWEPREPIAGRPLKVEVTLKEQEIFPFPYPSFEHRTQMDEVGREPWQVFIVDKTFSYFCRMSLSDANFRLDAQGLPAIAFQWIPPRPGTYGICVAYRSHGHEREPYFLLEVKKTKRPDGQEAVRKDDSTLLVSGAPRVRCGKYWVSLQAPRTIRAGHTCRLSLSVRDGHGRSVLLEPCGGAAVCGVAIRSDLQQWVPFQGRPKLKGSVFFQRSFPRWMGMPYHATPERFVGLVELPLNFVLGGAYRLCLQFFEGTQTYTAVFPLEVEGAMRPWWLPPNRARPRF
ncbi:copper resistance CopC family protein [Candidatus Methylacidithermus pantelleriae]|nr:copper resistance protein CopC [Candidatus Methylacidithermus pantelleriae]